MAESVEIKEGAYVTIFDLSDESEETYLVHSIDKHPTNGSANVELAQQYKAPKMLHIRAPR